jgi:hypothetical protein
MLAAVMWQRHVLRIIANRYIVMVLVWHCVVEALLGALCCRLYVATHSFCLGNMEPSSFKDPFLLEARINTSNIISNKSIDIILVKKCFTIFVIRGWFDLRDGFTIRDIIINLSHLGRTITKSISKYCIFIACVITWAANTDVGAMLLPNVPEIPPRTNFK